jgi:hypothetical protein
MERPHSMAVGADQLTLGDLREDRLPTEASESHVADLTPLRRTWQVIPVHRSMMKNGAAIDAGRALQASIPLHEVPAIDLAHLDSIDTRPAPVGGVVLAAARLAPGLKRTAPAMELGSRLVSLAAAASLRHVARIAISDDNMTYASSYRIDSLAWWSTPPPCSPRGTRTTRRGSAM